MQKLYSCEKGEATDSQKDRFPGSADNDVYFLNELTEDENNSSLMLSIYL